MNRPVQPLPPRIARSAGLIFIALVLSTLGRGSGVRAQAQLVLKIASVETSRSPLGQHLRALARDIGERTRGSTHVKVFGDGVLGDEEALLERTVDGSIQMYAGQLRTLAKRVPEVAVLSAPFIFRNDKQSHRALDRRIRKALEGVLERRGLVFGGFGGTARRVLISETPLTSPNDLKGLAMQTPQPHPDVLRLALGTTEAGPIAAQGESAPTPIVDATPLRALAASRKALGKHVLLTEHALEVSVCVYSKRWFDGLPEDLRKELQRPSKGLTAQARAHRAAQNARVLEAWKAAGVDVQPMSAAQRKAFGRALRKVAPQIANRAGIRSWKLLRAARRG